MRQVTSITQPSTSIAISRLHSSPIGPLWVAVTSQGLARVEWDLAQSDFSEMIQADFRSPAVYDTSRTSQAIQQLSEYLDGSRFVFTLPIDLYSRTDFQRQVLQLTAQIPYGRTATYKDLALRIGKPQAARAVGRVEATNPLPLVIPCHRVLGSDGSLHGYGGPGDIKLKAWLLELEHSAI